MQPFSIALALLAVLGPQSDVPASQPKVVFLGFDGFDHALARRWIADGSLPSLARLAKDGAFSPLEPSNPALSRVSWASALTGVNPGRHGVFDFVKREFGPSSRAPVPSLLTMNVQTVSADALDPATRRELAAARGVPESEIDDEFQVPGQFVDAPLVLADLADAGIRVVGLRVPLAFPPGDWKGARVLSGLFTPDVWGGVGRWFLFDADEWVSSRPEPTDTGGMVIRLFGESKSGVRKQALFPTIPLAFGPKVATKRREPSPPTDGARLWEASAQVAVTPNFAAGSATFEVDDALFTLRQGEWSPYVRMRFALPGSTPLEGLARFVLVECGLGPEGEERLRIYVPPISLAPDAPVLVFPFSTPRGYAAELMRSVGAFATAGWPTPTNALKDGLIDDPVFCEGLRRASEEDARLLAHELDRGEFDVLLAFFHGADHAGHLLGEAYGGDERATSAVRDAYRRLDAVVGDVLSRIGRGELGEGATLIVASDHGMASFERSASLNRWLADRGFLAVEPNGHGVDWTRTRAYAMGLGGIYLNLRGREPLGVVDPAESSALAREIASALMAWRDDARNGARVVRRVYPTAEVYEGPHAGDGPDLLIGFEPPYRVAWSDALGGLAPSTSALEGNATEWDGDHASVDPSAVPGVFFVNRKVELPELVSILDLAPTLCAIAGVPRAERFEGRELLGR